MRLLPLLGATYFMVAGGPYGLEDIIGKAGYARALLLLAIIPSSGACLPPSWSASWPAPYQPKAASTSGSAAPSAASGLSGGVAVARSQRLRHGHLSHHLCPLPGPPRAHMDSRLSGTFWALAVVLGCTLWNLTGAKAVGQSSVALFCVLLAPFVILITAGL